MIENWSLKIGNLSSQNPRSRNETRNDHLQIFNDQYLIAASEIPGNEFALKPRLRCRKPRLGNEKAGLAPGLSTHINIT
jgi:hypothetical protein